MGCRCVVRLVLKIISRGNIGPMTRGIMISYSLWILCLVATTSRCQSSHGVSYSTWFYPDDDPYILPQFNPPSSDGTGRPQEQRPRPTGSRSPQAVPKDNVRPSPVSMKLQEKSINKPEPKDWIRGREMKDKLNIISWLIDGCLINGTGESECKFGKEHEPTPEYQTFDGFYNNLWKVDLGAVDTPLLRRVAPVYEDGVYEPVKGNRINPFNASDELMTRRPECGVNKDEACGSKTGKTAFLVFFGQQVVEEILDAQRPGCPPEYFNIEITEQHELSKSKKKAMPLLRSRWSQSTGQSPGNPRQQLNEITPWIDGGLIYGTAKGWADVLRTYPNGTLAEHGLLASEDSEGLFPVRNDLRLPMANPPPPAYHEKWVKRHETAKVDRFFVLGNPRGNENAFLLSFGVVLFRWHNLIAAYLHQTRPHWSGERIFQEARKWVIGTYQSMVVYKWLPEWLGEDLGQYKGYDPSVDPQIEQFFQTAAMRFGHTLVTPGAYMRDYACGACEPIPFYGVDPHNNRSKSTSEGAVRTCNIFWRPQEPLEMSYKSSENCEDIKKNIADIDRILMGMASQRAEREDNMIVEDLRGKVFGPLEFSRRDLMAVNIQRGRDHGTPDYNTAREAFGLDRIDSVDKYLNLTGSHTPRKILDRLEAIHGKGDVDPWSNIDVWTGGILETSYRPGPLFRAIIKDQFERIRIADRFWFENEKWEKRRFTRVQIDRIKELEVFDMIVGVTQMKEEDIQSNPFRLPGEDFKRKSESCFLNEGWLRSNCSNYANETITNNFTCYHFPQLDSNSQPVEECTEVMNYDFFNGSEISFMLTYTAVGFVIIGIASLVPLTASVRQRKKHKALLKLQKHVRTSLTIKVAGVEGNPTLAREWMGHNRPSRAVALVFITDKSGFEIRNHGGGLLRSIDLSRKESLDLILVTDGKHLILKNPSEYDCVLEFGSSFLRDSFYTSFQEKVGKTVTILEQQGGLRQSLSTVTTKEKRIARLETFFKVVFAHAFAIEQPKGKEKLLDAKIISEVIKTELTQAEFADALGMQSTSSFVQRMFELVDRDQNGFISFREFLDMLIIFAKGSAEDKMKLMFDMYDISRTGDLTEEEFKAMIRSLVEASRYDVNNDEIEAAVRGMMQQSGLKRDPKTATQSKITFQDFIDLMSHPDNKQALGYANLNFSGVNVLDTQMKGSRKSYVESARATVWSMYGGDGPPPADETSLELHGVSLVDTSRTKESPFSKWVELYRLQLFWGILYTLVFVAIFAERAYVYSIESEHGGLRHIAGYGVSVTRGAASAIMFTYSTLLLTMCRNSITYLRETFLHRVIPFDSFLPMHKYIAILGLVSSCFHIIGHAVNFYHISTQTSSDLTCLFRDYYRATHVLPKFHYWAFQTITGITGVLLVVLGALIYTFATSYARSNAFKIFWATHATYPIFYILILLHGSGRLVQEPLFGLYLVGPLIVFILDKLITVGRKKVEIPVLDAKLLPSSVTKLEFARPVGFEYKSGQWVRIACLKLNPAEFHPFTLSSAPHEPHLTVHIRAVGPFTASIRHIYERAQTPLPKLYLDGPYGEGHQDWWRYEVSVLVGGGIGVTPFASILKDVAASQNPRSCKKIYFIWVTRTQKQFEWLVDIIREVENCKIVAVHLFITQTYEKFDMRTVLLYMCERHFQRVSNKSLFTGLRSVTHFGRPNFLSLFKSLTKIHSNVKKFGVFSCGPFNMTKSVDEACALVSTSDDSKNCIFQHHFENF